MNGKWTRLEGNKNYNHCVMFIGSWLVFSSLFSEFSKVYMLWLFIFLIKLIKLCNQGGLITSYLRGSMEGVSFAFTLIGQLSAQVIALVDLPVASSLPRSSGPLHPSALTSRSQSVLGPVRCSLPLYFSSLPKGSHLIQPMFKYQMTLILKCLALISSLDYKLPFI